MVNHNARLDAHEQLIQKLQDDLTAQSSRLDSIAAALEADRLENSEFRKMMASFVRQQEKNMADDGSLGSGIFESGGGSQGPSHSLPSAVKKVKLPEFCGFDPQGWIQKANLYFDINQTPDTLRLRLAQLSMSGVAQHWFTVLKQVHDSLTWSDFQSELLQRFSGLEIHNPYEQLATIQQSDSIHDYIEDFEYLLSLIPRLPESQTLGYFVAGLKEDVKQRVRLHRPTSCIDAMSLARDVELMLRPSDSSSLLSRFRHSQPVGLPVEGSGFRHHSWGTRVSKPVGNSGSVSGFGAAGYRDRGIRSLSRTEWEERQKKGQCYKCGQPYSPTHTCPNGKLRVMLLGDDEPDEFEGLHFQLEQLDDGQSDRGSHTAMGFSTKP
uniref:Putative retrotransposon gag domain-containing protein n=1 Tax=Helianthus annuus TaxID=4232 RepID=A0A251UQ20_HELAN